MCISTCPSSSSLRSNSINISFLSTSAPDGVPIRIVEVLFLNKYSIIMRKYKYIVYFDGLKQQVRFNTSSLTYLNRRLRNFIRLNSIPLNIVIIDYNTHNLLQNTCIFDDSNIFNRFDYPLFLYKHYNIYYFAYHEKNKIR